jgi:hypothetical protein
VSTVLAEDLLAAASQSPSHVPDLPSGVVDRKIRRPEKAAPVMQVVHEYGMIRTL